MYVGSLLCAAAFLSLAFLVGAGDNSLHHLGTRDVGEECLAEDDAACGDASALLQFPIGGRRSLGAASARTQPAAVTLQRPAGSEPMKHAAPPVAAVGAVHTVAPSAAAALPRPVGSDSREHAASRVAAFDALHSVAQGEAALRTSPAQFDSLASSGELAYSAGTLSIAAMLETEKAVADSDGKARWPIVVFKLGGPATAGWVLVASWLVAVMASLAWPFFGALRRSPPLVEAVTSSPTANNMAWHCSGGGGEQLRRLRSWELACSRDAAKRPSLISVLALLLGWRRICCLLGLAACSHATATCLMVVGLDVLLRLAEGPGGRDPFDTSLLVLLLAFGIPRVAASLSARLADREREAGDIVAAALEGILATRPSVSASSQRLAEVLGGDAAEILGDIVRAAIQCLVLPPVICVLLFLLEQKIGVLVFLATLGCAPLLWTASCLLRSTVQPRVEYALAARSRCLLARYMLESICAVKGSALEEPMHKSIVNLREKEVNGLVIVQSVGLQAVLLCCTWPRALALIAIACYSALGLAVDAPRVVSILQIFLYFVSYMSVIMMSLRKVASSQSLMGRVEALLRPDADSNLGDDARTPASLVREGQCGRDRSLACRPEHGLREQLDVNMANAAAELLRHMSSEETSDVVGNVDEATLGNSAAGEQQKDDILDRQCDAEAPCSADSPSAFTSLAMWRRSPWEALRHFVFLAGEGRLCACIALLSAARLTELTADVALAGWASGIEPPEGGRILQWPCATLCMIGIGLRLAANAAGARCSAELSLMAHRQLMEAVVRAPASLIAGAEARSEILERLTGTISTLDFKLWPRAVGLCDVLCGMLCLLAYACTTLWSSKDGGLRSLGVHCKVGSAVLLFSFAPGALLVCSNLWHIRLRAEPPMAAESMAHSRARKADSISAEADMRLLSSGLVTCAAVAYAFASLEAALRPTGSVPTDSVGVSLTLFFLAILPQALQACVTGSADLGPGLTALARLRACATALPCEAADALPEDPRTLCAIVEIECSKLGPFQVWSKDDGTGESAVDCVGLVVSRSGKVLFRPSADGRALAVEPSALEDGVLLQTSPGGRSFSSCLSENVVGPLHVVAVNGLGTGCVGRLVRELLASCGRATLVVRSGWLRDGARVDIRNLYVAYSPREPPVLRGLTATLEACDHIALIGGVGTGKSALLMSLLRLLEPRSGAVRLDAIDISCLSLGALRTKVAFVSQEPLLFGHSVRHSLDPLGEFSDRHLLRVLRQLGMEDVAKNGLGGAPTRLSDSSRCGTEGAARLLVLARVVLRQAPLVLIDQAWMEDDAVSSRSFGIRAALASSTVLEVFQPKAAGLTGFSAVLAFCPACGSNTFSRPEPGKDAEGLAHTAGLCRACAAERQ